MQMSSSRRGFSLIEAIVAVAVLLATCLAVSASLTVALQADRQVERHAALEEILGSESARLASLPFRRTTAAPVVGLAWSPDPRSLLGEVFPHAGAGHNGGGSYHVEGGVGVFVARRTVEDFEIVSETRFVRRGDDGWMAVPAASLQGWSVWGTQPLPAATVELRLTTSRGSATASAQMILGALRTRVSPVASGLRGSREG